MGTNRAVTTLKHAAKFKWSLGTILIFTFISVYAVYKIKSGIDSIKYKLEPPSLPSYQSLETDTVYLNAKGWPNVKSEWFHHASQGTATIPIPYKWLLALEAPKNNPWFVIFGKEQSFKDEYILRHGFIKGEKTRFNPDELPIGFAKTESIYFSGIDRKADALGFTCAACHTGQVIYDQQRFVIDGAPAMTDLGLFTRSLGAALGQTFLSSKIPLLNGRFDRFAEEILGSNDNILTREQLKSELAATIKSLANTSDIIDVTEGFTRLDALNRIGNAVFTQAMDRQANYSPIDAPVNYPHIWTTSWFNWVQYDGSIMQPLVRNSGEALGVKAFVDTKGPDNERFASSVNIHNLAKIEEWLSGTHPKKNGNKFNGLTAPKWPEQFPPVDQNLVANGKLLYQEMCQGCHLPVIADQKFWTNKYWKTIPYTQGGIRKETAETYLNLYIIPLDEIGTDTAQAKVLQQRTVDTTGLNLNTEVCTKVSVETESGIKTALSYVPLRDSATANYGLSLGAVVERTNQQWLKQNYILNQQRGPLEGNRPNCLQVGKGYKARPLNGIWATAPFLHNGSIANLYDLLSAAKDRPTFIELGSQEFDPKHVGIKQSKAIEKLNKKGTNKSYNKTADYSKNHYFILDTREPGNFNIGHSFEETYTGRAENGVVGRAISDKERMALIEYLKTI